MRVLFFGVLKERFGTGEALELPEATTVGDLMRQFRQREGVSPRLVESLAVAVNREYAQAGAVLREGDEVALLPPVSGGRR